MGGKWVQLVTQNDGGTSPTTSTFTERRTAEDCRAITTLYSGTGGAKFDMMTCGAAHKGCVVWGTKGGYRNIRWSRIGDAERFAEDIDENLPDEDLNVGATFSLADNFGDEPLAIFSTGDVVIIVGSLGVYAQLGNTPLEATPPKKLPGSFGCANKLACCAWKDDAGNPGVAFLSKDGTSVWFAMVDQSFDGISGFRMIQISTALSTDLRSNENGLYLLLGRQSESSNLLSPAWPTVARLTVDPFTDSLRLYNGFRRCLVLSAPGAGGERQWVVFEYNWAGTLASFKFRYVSATSRRGHRTMDSGGRFLLMEYDWTDANPISVPYSGSLRDAGLSIFGSGGTGTTVYWESAAINDHRRRVAHCNVSYSSGIEPFITIGGDVSSTKQLSNGTEWARFGAAVSGQRLTYKFGWQYSVSQTDLGNTTAILQVEINEEQLNERRRY